jgi:predicted PurR-regulated permease PerM
MNRPINSRFKPERISYVFIALALVLVGWLNLPVLILTVLFGYFALEKLALREQKWLAVVLFLLLLTLAGYGFYAFFHNAVKAVPAIAQDSIPKILSYAQEKGFQLPTPDYSYEMLKRDTLGKVQEEIGNLGKYAGGLLRHLVAFIIGVVVAVSLFLNTRVEPDADPETGRDNLYSQTFLEVVARFRTFYQSFKTVMGAQIVISLINALLTSIFLVWNQFPYAPVLAGLTFLLGLLPIVGNLMSNTLIVSVGFTITPRMAFFALIFLVVIHKFEYFLNSKIIGDRIKNPMWLTLLGLLIGEKLMGIPGMILAPVVLHYIKVEASRSRLSVAQAAESEVAEERSKFLEPDIKDIPKTSSPTIPG